MAINNFTVKTAQYGKAKKLRNGKNQKSLKNHEKYLLSNSDAHHKQTIIETLNGRAGLAEEAKERRQIQRRIDGLRGGGVTNPATSMVFNLPKEYGHPSSDEWKTMLNEYIFPDIAKQIGVDVDKFKEDSFVVLHDESLSGKNSHIHCILPNIIDGEYNQKLRQRGATAVAKHSFNRACKEVLGIDYKNYKAENEGPMGIEADLLKADQTLYAYEQKMPEAKKAFFEEFKVEMVKEFKDQGHKQVEAKQVKTKAKNKAAISSPTASVGSMSNESKGNAQIHKEAGSGSADTSKMTKEEKEAYFAQKEAEMSKSQYQDWLNRVNAENEQKAQTVKAAQAQQPLQWFGIACTGIYAISFNKSNDNEAIVRSFKKNRDLNIDPETTAKHREKMKELNITNNDRYFFKRVLSARKLLDKYPGNPHHQWLGKLQPSLYTAKRNADKLQEDKAKMASEELNVKHSKLKEMHIESNRRLTEREQRIAERERAVKAKKQHISKIQKNFATQMRDWAVETNEAKQKQYEKRMQRSIDKMNEQGWDLDSKGEIRRAVFTTELSSRRNTNLDFDANHQCVSCGAPVRIKGRMCSTCKPKKSSKGNKLTIGTP